MLIKRIYQVDPLQCPQCGGTMKIMSFIEARQGNVIRKILEHCGLRHDPPPRAPPRAPQGPVRPSWPVRPREPGITPEVDPDFLEHLHRAQFDPPDLPWVP